MKVKLDENVTHDAVAVFAAAGHDVHTVATEQLTGHPDGDIWAACFAEQRMVVTFDLGFGDVRAYPPASHAGVILLRLPDQQPAVVVDVLQRFLAGGAVRQARRAVAVSSYSSVALTLRQASHRRH